MHLLQPAKLLAGLLPGFLGHAGFANFLLVILDLLRPVVPLAQFPVDGPHLLAEKVIPLIFGNLVLYLGLNLRLNGGQVHLPRQQGIDLFKTLHRIDGFQYFLGFIDFQLQIRCHQVRQLARIFDALQNGADITRQFSPQGQDLLREFADIPHQRFHFDIEFLERHLLQRFDFDPVETAFPHIALDFDLGDTLHQGFGAPIRQFQHP